MTGLHPSIGNPRWNERRLLAVSLCLGLLHHYLFYAKSWGISFPLFVAVFYSILYGAMGGGLVLNHRAGVLLLPIGLLSLSYGIYTNTLFLVLNALAVPALIVLQTTLSLPLTSSRVVPLPLRVLEQLLVQTVLYIPRPAVLTIQVLTKSGGMRSSRSRAVLKIGLGMLLSIPLLLVVGVLLASADTMFDRALSNLPNLLEQMNTGQTIFRIVWVVFITVGVFAYMAGLLQPKPWPAYPGMGEGAQAPVQETTPAAAAGMKPSAKPTEAPGRSGPSGLDPTVVSTMLFMLNAVYVLFAFVQFSYFFGGGAAQLPEGITYAAYARKGFAELVVVTMINLTVLLTCVYGIRRPAMGVWLFLRSLLALLVGCTGVMLSSAYMRLSMYEEAYGYTSARLLVHAFMIVLLLLFLLTLAKLWREKLPLMRCYAVTALTAYVLMNYIGMDGMIARNNIARYEASGVLDEGYLGSLSYEAVPYVLELYKKHPELAGVQEVLQRYKSRLEEEQEESWSEFNLSKQRASKLLAELK